jgi:hypothetical protein
MKFGIRRPSLKKKLAARTSFKRVVRHQLGFKAPRGYGWITNPKKAYYNEVYNKTNVGCSLLLELVSRVVEIDLAHPRWSSLPSLVSSGDSDRVRFVL